MSRTCLMATTAVFALLSAQTPAAAQVTGQTSTNVENITITAQRLAEQRIGIQTQIGASTYTVSQQQIKVSPGGDNTLLNQVVLQAPGVAQDSFGQLHVRGEHNGLQYRLNGIIIPEGISVFGQTLDPRLADSVQLITGALPAEYGDRTAGIIDIRTKTGFFNPGGEVTLYGGSHSEMAPSFAYGGSSGHLNYFVSGDYMTNTLGIESPDGSSDPNHDRTNQWHGFAYLQDLLTDNSSLTAVLGTSNDEFQIPNRVGLQPSGLDGIIGLGPRDSGSSNFVLQANGQTDFPSQNLDERQREITHYGILSYLDAEGPFDYQISLFGRYSSLNYTPGDNLGGILYNGIAQKAYKRDEAYGVQAEGDYHVSDTHTIRFGLLYQADDLTSETLSQVLRTAPGSSSNPNPNPGCTDPANTCQTSDVPRTIADNGAAHAWNYGLYIQDEWKITPSLTVNYGVRYDQFQAYDAEDQLSPRINMTWMVTDSTTFHAGYARYFSPPPIELVASKDIALFDDTTSAASHTDDTPKAERANYFDAGINQKVSDTLSLGLDSYYKTSRNLIDEGQFGAPIILTPFNYRKGLQYGLELTATYSSGNFASYLNASYERASGEGIVTSQFQFDPGDLAYIANHYIPLDHQQIVTLSGGASYNWDGTTLSADMIYGSGLRSDGATPNGNHVPGYIQVNLGLSRQFMIGDTGGYTARIDVINLFDEKYEIRDGTGVGVGAPQYGPRRGIFVGLSKTL